MAKASMRNATAADIIPGALIRMCYAPDGAVEAVTAGWSDCCVSTVKDGIATLVRPRVTFFEGKAVVRDETFEAPVERFVGKAHWQLVLDSRGEPENYAR